MRPAEQEERTREAELRRAIHKEMLRRKRLRALVNKGLGRVSRETPAQEGPKKGL